MPSTILSPHGGSSSSSKTGAGSDHDKRKRGFCLFFLVAALLSPGHTSAFQTIQSSPNSAFSPLESLSLAKKSNELSWKQEHKETELLSNVAWIQNRFGLTNEWAEKPAARNLAIHTMDQSELIGRVNWLQKKLKLKDNECGKIIQKFPNVLGCRPDTNLEPTLIFLQENLGLNGKELSRIIQKQPSILGVGIGRHQTLQRNLNWIQKRLYLSKPKQIGKLVLKLPALLTYNVTANLEPTVTLLQERLDLNETQVGNLCAKAPSVLSRNYTTGLEPKLDWFQNRLNLNQAELGKMIRKQPSLLGCSVEDNLEPNLIWLKERLHLDDDAVRKMVLSQPQIFYLSPSEKLEPCLQWLRKNLALDGCHDLAMVMTKHPSLFGYSLESNLDPTLEFYKQWMGNKEAVKELKKDPRIFAASLEKRLKPRLEQLQQHGIVVDAMWVKRMAKYTPIQWEQYLSRQPLIALT